MREKPVGDELLVRVRKMHRYYKPAIAALAQMCLWLAEAKSRSTIRNGATEMDVACGGSYFPGSLTAAQR
jgi:hypothetical protein